MFERIFGNFKTTIGGTAMGASVMGLVYEVIAQAGCDFSHVQWLVILAGAFLGPTAVGAFSTDNGKAVGPVPATTKVP